MFGKKAGSVINLKFVFYLLVRCLIEVFSLFIRFFAKHSDVKRELKAEITQKKSIENKHLFPQEINKAEA